MTIEELEAQFNRIDKLSSSESITVRFEDTSSILQVIRPGHAASFPNLSVDSRGSAGGRHIEMEPATADEYLMEIDLSQTEVPDEFIDEKIKLAINRMTVGELPSVKLMGLGATGVYEVIENYSYKANYDAIGREMSSEDLRQYHSLVGLPHEERMQRISPICTITVPRGFQYDRASIPRIFWLLISKDDLSNVPPLFHDFLYRYAGALPNNYVNPYTQFTRDEADSLFGYLMGKSGVAGWRKALAYQAVSHFSSFAWKKSSAN